MTSFTFPLRTARARPGVLFLLGSLLASGAQARTPTPPVAATAPDATQAAPLVENEIVVNGDRPRGAPATDIPVEVSINAAVIAALDAVDLNEVFQQLAPEIGNGTAGQNPIVLVNGQRIASFSSIKSVPPDAVARIEIYPEEVALQYGFSPGQRVVNVVLRSSYHALLLLARDTIEPESWRWIYEGKVDLTRIDANSHWNLDVDFQHAGPLYAASTLAGTAPAATDATVPRYSIDPQTDELNVSGSLNHTYGSLTTEFAGHIDLKTTQSRLGLADQDGALLASQGLSDLINGPLGRIDNTVNAQASTTLNGRLDAWRWSFVGVLDATTRQTHTDAGLLAGGFEALTLPSPILLGQGCGAAPATDCVSTNTQRAGGDLFLNGNLFALPAGQVSLALRGGFAFSRVEAVGASVPGSESNPRFDHSRNEGNIQANLDFPITDRASWLGKLSGGINGGIRQLSDFGTLTTLGASAQWSPARRIEFMGSFSRQEQAPDLLQLGSAALVTPDVREFDFANGGDAIVQRTDGGNVALTSATANVARFRLQASPFAAQDLALSAEYTIQHTSNPIVALTAATSAAELAFPDRFTRSDDGYLTAMDVSPVNIASRDQQQLRWGINWTTAFGSDRPGAGDKSEQRDQFQIALYHTWRFQDRVVLQQGQAPLDLLGHDLISDTGGTSRHQIELQTTIATRPWSVDFNAVWQSPTTASPDNPLPTDRLTFSNGIALNVKFQIRLAEIQWLTHLFPHIKGSIRLSADNILNGHLSVHDATGAVPAAYSTAYIKPPGPTIRLTVRKVFR